MMDAPDDIRRAARSIAHVVFIAGSEQDDLTYAIADALMTERERGAEIAENYEAGLSLNGDDIALAIRSNQAMKS